MNAIWVISALTFKEAIRNRILYLLFFFALGLVLFSWVIGKLTVGDEVKIIKDLGLSSIHFFGILITIFIGIGLIFREMEKRTIYLVLSKPIRRHQFLIGKLGGLAFTLFLVLSALVTPFYIILWLKGEPDPKLLLAVYFIFLEWLVIAGIAVLFSSFSSPLLSAMFTFSAFLAGHLTESLLMLRERIASEFGNLFLSILFYVLPNLEMFNIRAQIVHNLALPDYFFLKTSLYWVLYLGAILLLSIRVFREKDFV
jgi:ABC-type transport system involved in multi-copper enzyme maturation permease subunit